MNTVDLIEKIEGVLTSSTKLMGRRVIEEKQLVELMEQLRKALPDDIMEAQRVLRERAELIAQGEREAKRLQSAAEEEFKAKLKDTHLVRAAEHRAQEILREAQGRADSALSEAARRATARIEEANQYTLGVLRTLETQLTATLSSIHKGVALLEGKEKAEDTLPAKAKK